jgi:AcrR family transcriptional regulator
MLSVSTCDVVIVNMSSYIQPMRSTRAARPVKKPKDQYHHGDLRRALLQAAVRTVQKHGFSALTLRAVGDELGVSRTALYRHFADKSALLTAVAAEGFRMLRTDLVTAWDGGGQGLASLMAMGEGYVRFALANPWHYRVMFGSGFELVSVDPELRQEGNAAFQALADALLALQAEKRVRQEDVPTQANFVWSVVHGVAMLGIDGSFDHRGTDIPAFTRYAVERLTTGIAS